MLSLLACLPSSALSAQGLELTGRPRVAAGSDALPGVADVAFALPTPALLCSNGDLLFAYTEGVIDGDDSHRRIGGRAALALRTLPWLSAGFRTEGHFDHHSGGPGGVLSGFVSELRLLGRANLSVSDAASLGAQLTLRFPGAKNIDNRLAAVTPQGRLIGSFAPASWPLALAANLGFRYDRLGRSIAEPFRLLLEDRVALGGGEASVLLLGAALSAPLGALDVVGAVEADLQLGPRAAELPQSPMRVQAGLRYLVGPGLQLEFMAGVSPSARPPIDMQLPLYPVEPRLWLRAGVAVYLEAREPRREAPPAPPPEVRLPTTGALRGVVRDGSGQALGQARVVVGELEVLTDSNGGFELRELPQGAVQLRVEAAGFQPAVVEAGVAAARTQSVEIVLERKLPEGQVRGTVRSLSGEPLAAQVRVEPLGLEIQADESGSFVVDVAPGEYTITINAPGYALQRRRVAVEDNGVTVIIVDLGEQR